MKVRRIVADIDSQDLDAAEAFYHQFLGLSIPMDHGWIKTFGSDEGMTVQVSVASEGGSGAQVPDLSIEVDDVSVALEKAKSLGIAIEYGLLPNRGAFAASMCVTRSVGWSIFSSTSSVRRVLGSNISLQPPPIPLRGLRAGYLKR